MNKKATTLIIIALGFLIGLTISQIIVTNENIKQIKQELDESRR
jgi:hypothetical protein